ncbi:MAG: hypothetical protein ACQESG_05490 [Nanobdellota archaeon]
MYIKDLLAAYCAYTSTRYRQKRIASILSGKPLRIESIAEKKSGDLRHWAKDQASFEEFRRRIALYMNDEDADTICDRVFEGPRKFRHHIKEYSTNTGNIHHLNNELGTLLENHVTSENKAKARDLQYLATDRCSTPTLLYRKACEVLRRHDNVTGYRVTEPYPLNRLMTDLFQDHEVVNIKRWHNKLIKSAHDRKCDWLTYRQLRSSHEVSLTKNDEAIPGRWYVYPGTHILSTEHVERLNLRLDCDIQTKTFHIRYR